MFLHSLIVHTNSIVSAASKAVTFQRRATRLNASVPPLRCRHPARASRAPLSKKLRFCFGRLHFIPAACAERPRLRCVQSLRFLPLPIVTFSVLPRFLFLSNCLLSASTHCRGISSMSAVSQREPSAAIKFMPLRTDSIVFFFSWFSASIDCLRLQGQELAFQDKHLPTVFRPRPPTPFWGVLL